MRQLLLLLLLLFLLTLSLVLSSEILIPKSWLIKANPQAWSCFNSGSQAVLWHMLSDWTCVQKSRVQKCEQHKDDVKKHH